MEELFRLREAADDSAVIRRIGGALYRTHALAGHHPAGRFEVPASRFDFFHLQLTGRPDVTLEGIRILRTPPPVWPAGTFALIPCARPWAAIVQGGEYAVFQILVPRPLLRRALEVVLVRDIDDEETLLTHVGPANDRLHRLTHLMLDEFRARRIGDTPMMDALMEAFSIELARIVGLGSTDDRSEALSGAEKARLMALMEDSVDGSISLGDIAEALGLSPARLTRRFREGFGDTPSRYLIGLRLARAQRLLAESDEPLADIAAACGFSSQAHMSTAFGRHLGTTPARYRASRSGRPR